MAIGEQADPRPAIVVGVEDPESGRLVLAQALDLADRLGAELLVSHVTAPVALVGAGLPAGGMAGGGTAVGADEARISAEIRRRNEEWVQALHEAVAGELGFAHVPWSQRHTTGDPATVLVALAEQVDAYCVVVGSRGGGLLASIGRLVRPSVSRSVLRERRVPVLVVPTDDDVTEDASEDSPAHE